mgnify:CR=1 FL=1
MGIFKKKYKYSDPTIFKSIGPPKEWKLKSDRNSPLIHIGAVGIAGAVGMMTASTLKKNLEKKSAKLKSTKKETKQKQSMTSNKAYSSKFFGHTDNKNK